MKNVIYHLTAWLLLGNRDIEIGIPWPEFGSPEDRYFKITAYMPAAQVLWVNL